MNLWYAVALGGLSSAWLSLTPLAKAQDTAVTPATPSLEQIVAEIKKIDQDLAAKIQALRVTIDTESTAKRITESVAQSLRYSLRIAATGASTDFGAAIASNRLPVEDGPLMDAIKAVENDWAAAQALRLKWVKAAAKEAEVRAGALARSAQKPAELDPMIALMESLQDAVPARTAATNSALGSTDFRNLTGCLRNLQRLLEAQSQSDPSALGFALSQFQYAAGNSRSAFSEGDVQQRIQQALVPYLKAQDDAQEALDRLLTSGKGAAEVAPALTKFEQAADQLKQAHSNVNLRTGGDASAITNLYPNLSQISASLEAGQFTQAKNLLAKVRNSGLQALGPAKLASYTQLMSTWEKVIDDGVRKSAEKRSEEFRSRLAALKTPADLEALATELSKTAVEPGDGRDPDPFRGIANQLNALAVAWASGSPNILNRENYGNSGDLRFAADLGDLRKRVERDVLARVLRAPELNQPPLLELTLDAAIEKLGGQLAEKGEWRRLLQVLETWAGQGRFDGTQTRDGDVIAAVRAFLAGQNFELAEQWADAVLSYKSVLRATSERAPIKQAAERLKELNKQHPEVFTPQTSPTRGLPAQ